MFIKKDLLVLFKNTVGRFENDPTYNLVLISGKLSDGGNYGGVAACTDGEDNAKDPSQPITIYIVNSTMPTLEMAATLLHEGIHAEMFRYVSRHASNVDSNDRLQLLQFYQYYKGLSSKLDVKAPVTIAQHEYLAEHYAKPIVEAIRLIDGSRYATEHYMGYGWEGLENTYKFKSHLSLSQRNIYSQKKAQINSTTNVRCN